MRKPWRFVRNVWLLRRELVVWLLRRLERSSAPKPVPVRCVRCGHELTKPCRPGSPCHVFKWPESMGEGVVDGKKVKPGALVYCRRQKARGGELRPDYELRLKPW